MIGPCCFKDKRPTSSKFLLEKDKGPGLWSEIQPKRNFSIFSDGPDITISTNKDPASLQLSGSPCPWFMKQTGLLDTKDKSLKSRGCGGTGRTLLANGICPNLHGGVQIATT